MASLKQATPLIVLPAAAIDTETTGLDVRKARLIEIAVLPIEGAKLDADDQFETLLDCGEAIPPEAMKIHGISAEMTAGAPRFADIHGRLCAALDGRVVIGHTVGFDVALLARECERAGLAPIRPLALDVRVLAQIVDPNLSTYSLEGLAAWLGVAVTNRHRAAGDAIAAGLVYSALLPRLRERGIRTLGEALSRCKAVTDAVAGTMPAEWETGVSPASLKSEPGDLERLDSYPYRHRVRDVMNVDPVVLPAETRVEEALRLIAARRLSSVLVGDGLASVGALAILTERDIMRLMAANGPRAFENPIGAHASRPLATVPEDALLYRAMGRMANLNIRHLVAVGADDSVTGIVTTRDLLKFRASSAIELGDDIDAATTVPELARAFAKLPAMARALLAEEVGARVISGVIAREIGALTRAAAVMAEREFVATGKGAPPCSYAVLVLGSAGRGESLLAMDQDNALIFEQGDPDGPEDRWFQSLAARMTTILDEVGVPLCKGGVMASNALFRGSLATWRERVGTWLTRASPEDLLAVDILFDFRAVHGQRALAAALFTQAWAAAGRRETGFLKQLAENAGETVSMVGFLGRIRIDQDGRIDLKRAVLKGLVTAARVLALHQGVATHATADRLAGLISFGTMSRVDLGALDHDHELVLRLILDQQLEDIKAGAPPDNRVLLHRIAKKDRDALKDALNRQTQLADMLRSALS